MQGHPERLTEKEKPVVKRAAGALALVAVLAGCQVPAGPTPRPGPVTTSAAPAAVEWADRLCGAILDYDSGTPEVEIGLGSQDSAITSLNTVLEKMSVQINGTLGQLGSIGPAPVPGGDEAARNLTSALERLRTVVDRLRPLANNGITFRANHAGELQLAVTTESALVEIGWTGLTNPPMSV